MTPSNEYTPTETENGAGLTKQDERVLSACVAAGFRIWKCGQAWHLSGHGERITATRPWHFEYILPPCRRAA